ncbi:MAG: HesA/MoeB/ThiF family protein, partial [Crocinitomicaceae bacterium]|nr:HesA/MoeB/ThiF family protein [Crocinitomicaceae bacterium]
MERYSRHILLNEVGQKGQEKISNARVLVVGAGGLGCPVLQYLTAAGVGELGIIDDDLVEMSNLQRQVLYGTSSLGLNKAEAAKKRLEDLNPSIIIHAYSEKLSISNAISLFEKYTIIVDGTDNFETRYLINDAAILTKRPVVYGAIYKFEGQLSVFNYKDGPSYRCLFPEPPQNPEAANCSQVGVLGVLPAIIGSMQANEVLKIILEIKGVLTGKLSCYDAKTSNVHHIKITKNERLINEIKNRPLKKEVSLLCTSNIQEITVEKALKKANVIFLDVREMGEEPTLEMD